ncbi:hypothetical protein BN946_scf184943.g81 [Trametes cinnabarina]|uniref:Bicarbonate transporter-like transmembrane domain-containing protein n=1 Tax=Pycnoporus cinnabarinus TaxID=5643 RepID=A0A060SCT9_PYCCI|nr:hypothetical protein BN946_scf184943.g81 [Trametes cinnabarina]
MTLPTSSTANEKSGHTGERAAATPSRSPSATLCRQERTYPVWLPTFIGRGIIRDIKARTPYYLSDWADSWNYRVIPAIVLIFFANVLPGIAFSLDLIETTQQYGVSEVLLSSFMAAFIFSIFGAQPLCIAGVTGPITVLNKTIFDIIERQPDPPNYLQFVGWVYLWGAILHWITAALNWCNFLKYVTLFSCDTFGFYVSWVYLEYGVQVVTRQFPSGNGPTPPTLSFDSQTSTLDGAFVGIILALLMTVTSFLFRTLSQSGYFHRHVRRFLADYGMPISLVASSAMAYWGRFNAANPTTLPTGHAFLPAGDRPWLVRFWELDGKWVGIAFPFGVALWVLFFFDHNVSSLMAQGSAFPLRKPPGFHYDFFLLGITTFIAGLLGIPAPNGLIPQAPIHTTSLLVMGHAKKLDIEEGSTKGGPRDAIPPCSSVQHEKSNDSTAIRQRNEADGDETTTTRTRSRMHPPPTDNLLEPDPTQARDGEGDERRHEVPIAVVEQRVSNLAQGSLCLVLLTGPFLHVLNLIPRGVLAGLFWYMGVDALEGNGITRKILYFFRDRALTSAEEPLRRVRKSRILLFVAVQLVGFGATMAITQTIAAIGFPIIIFLLVPVRMWLIPRLPFTEEELAILDGPTASPFTMESVGGTITTTTTFVARFPAVGASLALWTNMLGSVRLVYLLLLPLVAIGQNQYGDNEQTVLAPSERNAQPSQPSKSIAIVGAGSAGLAILKTLLDFPLDVRDGWEIVLYDQRRNVGGLWLPDPPGRPLPSPPELPESPVYPLLHTNTPHPTMTYPNFTYPPLTPLFPSHEYVQRYHYDFADHNGLLPYVRLFHKVAAASWVGNADGGQWEIEVHELNADDPREPPAKTFKKTFDHLVVANGHNHYPHIPKWNGTEGWLANTPAGTPKREILHSIYYRWPQKYTNRAVIIVGAGASGRDAALQVGKVARVAYQSLTPRNEPTPGANVIPKPRIAYFTNTSVVFEDGSVLDDVDSVILGTGYEFRVPFLSSPHSSVLEVDPDTSYNSTTAPTLVSNLRYIFPLHRHIFSLAAEIPPTALSFVGLPVLVANCPSDIAQSLLIAHAIANASVLPSRAQMLDELVAREAALRAEGFDPYKVGHRLVASSETDHDYQDALVEYLKDVGALPHDGRKFVEPWRRQSRAQSRLLGRAWERVVRLGREKDWLEGVETEEEWAELMARLARWQRSYEEEHGVPAEEFVSYE